MATVAATDQRVVALDDAQYETGEGPCLTVLDPHEPVSLDDAGEVDDRWEYFSHTATHLGINSTLSMHLPVDSEGLAASLQLAAAILIVEAYRSTAKLARDMAEAMRSRAVIEQAKGMLMSDKRISADEAFKQLVQLSQHANVKVREIAQRLVDERIKPPD